MKKWLLGFCVVVLLLFAAVFVFYPASLTVSESVTLSCNVNAASKFIEDPGKWGKWWPGGGGAGAAGDSVFSYQGFTYNFTSGLYHTAEVRIHETGSGSRDHTEGGDSGIGSRIALIALDTKDSLLIHWESHLSAGADPFSRIGLHRRAEKMSAGMSGLLSTLRTFLEKEENVYGVAIHETSTSDTFLVAVRAVLPAYPGTNDIYGFVNKLKDHFHGEGAMQTGYPMLNVTKSPDGLFKIMVAVPVNKTVSARGDIFSTRLVPGKFLVGVVQGDARAVLAAQDQMQNYISDFHRTAMAIPFQSLVTDRSQERDSTKWVTKLYYPIF